MDAPDTTLDEVTRKQLIWYGHVERMDPTRLPKLIINWKPEGRKKRGRLRRTWKDRIYTAMSERGLRMGECTDNKVRELATVCLPWQHWTKALVWFHDVDISAFHRCVVVDQWQTLFEWHLLMSGCDLVCRRENVGA